MNDLLERRVRAAAVAGWWTLLIAVIFLTAVWFIFRAMLFSSAPWIDSLWAGLDRQMVMLAALWMIGVLKLCLWLAMFVVIWLTLWARQLRKAAGSNS